MILSPGDWIAVASAAAAVIYAAGVHATTNRETRVRVEKEEAEREHAVERERAEREKSIERAIAIVKEQIGKDIGYLNGQVANFDKRAERGALSLETHLLKLGGVEGRTIRLEQRIDVDIAPRVHDFANKSAVLEDRLNRCDAEIERLRDRERERGGS